jgi:hypothetical protein
MVTRALLACPVCRRHRPDDHVMCVKCWRRVPAALQRNVYRAWGLLGRAERDGLVRDGALWDAYIDARDRAIESA